MKKVRGTKPVEILGALDEDVMELSKRIDGVAISLRGAVKTFAAELREHDSTDKMLHDEIDELKAIVASQGKRIMDLEATRPCDYKVTTDIYIPPQIQVTTTTNKVPSKGKE